MTVKGATKGKTCQLIQNLSKKFIVLYLKKKAIYHS